MTARDKTFTWGQVGLGTFDDHGNFDDFELNGVRVEKTSIVTTTTRRSRRKSCIDLVAGTSSLVVLVVVQMNRFQSISS